MMFVNQILKRCFPFDKMRPAQEDILNKIEAALTDDDIRYIIIEGQTGIGKSA
jgi:Rad3-related DNA helicase